MKRRLLALACLLVPAGSAAAQTNPITVLMGPAPNQILRLRATEVVETTTQPEPAQPSAGALERRQLHTTVTVDLTSTVGPADNRGRYEARVICDRASATATINGSAVPASDLKADEMVGRAVTIRYGENHEFRTLLEEGAGLGAHLELFRDLLGDSLPVPMPPPLSVGETVTVRGGPALTRAASGNSTDHFIPDGNTRYTLNAITFDGADRIAHLTMKSRGTGTFDLRPGIPGAGAPASVTIHVSGEGTSEVNIDRGIVIRHEQRVTTETSRHVKGGPTAPGLADLRTTSTVKLTIERIP